MKRILIVDDHIMIGRSLAVLLKHSGSNIDADAAASVKETLKLLADGKEYDLILLDFDMPSINGLEGLKMIKAEYPDQLIGMLSGIAEIKAVQSAIANGAIGWIPKTMHEEPLTHAIETMIAGGSFAPASFLVEFEKRPPKWEHLTKKEAEIADLIADGYSDKDISNELGISPRTTQNHVRALLKKANVDNRTKFASAYKSVV